MLRRFLGPTDGALLHKLFAVRQLGFVPDYRAQFELLAASVGPLDEPTLIAILINGLEEKFGPRYFS